MPLSHLEHFLVQTEDIERTRDWYCDVLGMVSGPVPEFKPRFDRRVIDSARRA